MRSNCCRLTIPQLTTATWQEACLSLQQPASVVLQCVKRSITPKGCAGAFESPTTPLSGIALSSNEQVFTARQQITECEYSSASRLKPSTAPRTHLDQRRSTVTFGGGKCGSKLSGVHDARCLSKRRGGARGWAYRESLRNERPHWIFHGPNSLIWFS
jgi:hypothetical protein